MKIKITDDEITMLRKMAVAGSAYQPIGTTAADSLHGLGFVEQDGLGGIRISAEGRKHLRDVDAKLE